MYGAGFVVCACALPLRLKIGSGSSCFTYLDLHLPGRLKKFTFEAVGESEARATWSLQTALHTHTRTHVVSASSCCGSRQRVLYVPDLAERCSAWHLEDANKCLLMTFYPPIKHFPNLHEVSGHTSSFKNAKMSGWRCSKSS